MNNNRTFDLDFKHLFMDDGSEAHEFGFTCSADNFHNYSTSPCHDLATGSFVESPAVKHKFIFDFPMENSEEEQQKEAVDYSMSDYKSQQPAELKKENSFKSDLNSKVADLVSGFRTAQIQKFEELHRSRVANNHKNRVSISSEPGLLPLDKLLRSDKYEPVKTSRICNGRIVSTTLTEELLSENSEYIMKPKRWGKEEDKIMFSNLRKL